MFDSVKRWAALSSAKTTSKDALWAMIGERHEDAMALAGKALETLELVDPTDHGVLECLRIIGHCSMLTGLESESERCFRRAIQIGSAFNLPTDEEKAHTASALSGLGALKLQQGSKEEAETLLTSAVAMLEDVPGHQPERAFPLFYLGLLYASPGFDGAKNAEDSFKTALKMIQFPPVGWTYLHTLRKEIAAAYAAFLDANGRQSEAILLKIATLANS